jgi:hypothetical protein
MVNITWWLTEKAACNLVPKRAVKKVETRPGTALRLIHPETGQVHVVSIPFVRSQEHWEHQIWPCIRGYAHADGKLYLHDPKRPMTKEQFTDLFKMIIAKRRNARPVPAGVTFGPPLPSSTTVKPVPQGATFGPSSNARPVPKGATFGRSK